MENDNSLEESLRSMAIRANTTETVNVGQTELPNFIESGNDQPDESVGFDNRTDLFVMRTIQFFEDRKRIVMQSANGPCPLIALANCLVLKNKLNLPGGKTFPDSSREYITCKELKELVGGCIVDMSSIANGTGEQDNYEKTLHDVLNLMPKLDDGLEVNVRFSGVSTFEYTPAVALFDLLNIPLYHTWVVEPGSGFEEHVGNMTYNQATTLAIENPILAQFLETTKSQMTYTGLIGLVDKMSNREIAVLFRNNHFHTVLKMNKLAHVLCTDIGFVTEPSLIWEVLQSIEGDTIYVDSRFSTNQNNREPAPTSSSSVSDYELAKQLDAQYNGLSPEGASSESAVPSASTTSRPPDSLPLENRSQTGHTERSTPKTQKCSIA
ncbi:unnamed protein product [Auanema sp. JU1783]|nr:unnamed protein product [Auanema sp. JU1783]